MAKNNNITELDSGQVFKRTVDGEHDAVRVIQAVNTEMYIELNSDDGDSVLSIPKQLVITEDMNSVNASKLREISKFGEGGSVHLSADGVDYFQLPINHLETKSICAAFIKVQGCKVVGRS